VVIAVVLLIKDIFREFSRNKARFISLVIITALGAMALVGIQATAINMRIAADRTYKEQALFDLHLRSTTGFTDDDIAAIYNTQGVAEVMGSFSFDVYMSIASERHPVRTFSLPNQLNHITLVEGRIPEHYNEIAVEQRILSDGGYNLGDRIVLSLNEPERFEAAMYTDEFTIVGVVSSPLFINFERGRTTLGSGVIRYYAYLHPEAYAFEVFTDVYIAMQGSREIFNLSEEYDALAQEWVEILRVTGDARIEVFNADIEDARQELEDLRIELEDMRTAINEALVQVENLPEVMRDILVEQITAGWNTYHTGITELNAHYEDLNSIPDPEWHYFTRRDGTAFDAFFQDTLRLQQIGYVFPTVFFLVAILVALTSMSRMVEEHRTQMGTYKALGYASSSLVFKYALYATISGSLGGIGGVAIGSQLFPRIIATAYESLYRLPTLETPIPWGLSLFAIITAVLSVLIITIVTCVLTTSGMPAALLRPKAPKPGKRVFLEKIPFVWKRLGFIEKVTARNIFRYKRRFFMTLIGVAGCTALIVTALGMRDSLDNVAPLQFDEILRYDVIVYTQEIRYPEQRLELESLIPAESRIFSRQETTTVLANSEQNTASLIVPEDVEFLSHFIHLESPYGVPFNIPNRGAILTEKLARDLGISLGDVVELRMTSGEVYEIFVRGITENYVFHFVYMSPEYYKEIFDASPYTNTLLLRGEFDLRELLAVDEVRMVVEMSDRERTVRDSTDALNIVVLLILVTSCALSLIVLFNLNIINLAERRRELATIKVVGFQNRETASYINRETLSVTFMGIISGLICGYFLSDFVISSIEIDLIKFPRVVNVLSFVYAAGLSLLFAILVSLITQRKLTGIDMVESLKSVE
jgi:putative ABC transport system permease protein